MKKETVARLNTIGRVGMNVFRSKDLFDKVKIRKKWFTSTLENGKFFKLDSLLKLQFTKNSQEIFP